MRKLALLFLVILAATAVHADNSQYCFWSPCCGNRMVEPWPDGEICDLDDIPIGHTCATESYDQMQYGTLRCMNYFVKSSYACQQFSLQECRMNWICGVDGTCPDSNHGPGSYCTQDLSGCTTCPPSDQCGGKCVPPSDRDMDVSCGNTCQDCTLIPGHTCEYNSGNGQYECTLTGCSPPCVPPLVCDTENNFNCECPVGMDECTLPDSSKLCTDLRTDPDNCGQCGRVANTNLGYICDNGTVMCAPGTTDACGTQGCIPISPQYGNTCTDNLACTPDTTYDECGVCTYDYSGCDNLCPGDPTLVICDGQCVADQTQPPGSCNDNDPCTINDYIDECGVCTSDEVYPCDEGLVCRELADGNPTCLSLGCVGAADCVGKLEGAQCIGGQCTCPLGEVDCSGVCLVASLGANCNTNSMATNVVATNSGGLFTCGTFWEINPQAQGFTHERTLCSEISDMFSVKYICAVDDNGWRWFEGYAPMMVQGGAEWPYILQYYGDPGYTAISCSHGQIVQAFDKRTPPPSFEQGLCSADKCALRQGQNIDCVNEGTDSGLHICQIPFGDGYAHWVSKVALLANKMLEYSNTNHVLNCGTKETGVNDQSVMNEYGYCELINLKSDGTTEEVLVGVTFQNNNYDEFWDQITKYEDFHEAITLDADGNCISGGCNAVYLDKEQNIGFFTDKSSLSGGTLSQLWSWISGLLGHHTDASVASRQALRIYQVKTPAPRDETFLMEYVWGSGCPDDNGIVPYPMILYPGGTRSCYSEGEWTKVIQTR